MKTDTASRPGSMEMVDALCNILGNEGLILGEDMVPYLQGARYGIGQAVCVARPSSREQVAAVVALCASRGVALVPQGANTGLVGASTPDATGTQIVLSLTRLRERCVVDPVNRTVEVDAGMLLHELNERLEPHGLWFPVDLAANPSIGGMIAANTGGTRLLRYGDVRHNLLAVEVVLYEPAGQIVELGKALRKNNTGFDLKQLFVGTSGAAGIVTGATLEVATRVQQSVTALLVPASDAAVATLLVAAETQLGDFLSAFEGLSANALQAALAHVPSLRNPFADEAIPEFSLLIELSSTTSAAQSGVDLEQLLTRFLEGRLDVDITNAILGRGDDLWRLRHSLSDGARALGKVIGFDISVRRSDVMCLRREAIDWVVAQHPYLTVVDFGHVGDGGLHFNLVWRHDEARPPAVDVIDRIRDGIYDLVVIRFGGSYSAEHGIGPHNHAYYLKYTPSANLDLSTKLQGMLDPGHLCGQQCLGHAGPAALHT